ncbi:Uncharacterised protein [uncultured archaeon]|nr:Uncharacterised protein [uncultured archaeon]
MHTVACLIYECLKDKFKYFADMGWIISLLMIGLIIGVFICSQKTFHGLSQE